LKIIFNIIKIKSATVMNEDIRIYIIYVFDTFLLRNYNSSLASGVYYYKIETEKFTSINKIVLIK